MAAAQQPSHSGSNHPDAWQQSASGFQADTSNNPFNPYSSAEVVQQNNPFQAAAPNDGFTLYHQFISESVLTRLINGQFVAKRRVDGKANDRRDSQSPLAITKRCVKYEHRVFQNRKEQIIQVAQCLNDDEKKVILVSGLQGIGKTSLARAAVEMMGGGPEQVLWFDLSLHTDHEEIIAFLTQYIGYVAELKEVWVDVNPESMSQEEYLEVLLTAMDHIPLLIVLDNIEFMVNEDNRLSSPILKRLLNTLLSFDHLKLMLIGERIPSADLGSNTTVVHTILLEGLPSQASIALLTEKKGNEGDTLQQGRLMTTAQQLSPRTNGFPWICRLFMYLDFKGLVSLEALNQALDRANRSTGGSAIETIVQFLVSRMSPDEREILKILSLVRHPADIEALMSICAFCKPSLNVDEVSLDHGLIKPLLKTFFPPQLVLEAVQRQYHNMPSGNTHAFQPWHEVYSAVKRVISQTLSADETEQLHQKLEAFYLQELSVPQAQRQYQVIDKALTTEAKYHRRFLKPLGPSDGALTSRSPQPTSRANLYGSEKRVTLDDYRQFDLPQDIPEVLEKEPDDAETMRLWEEALRSMIAEEEVEASIEEQMSESLQVVIPAEPADTDFRTSHEESPISREIDRNEPIETVSLSPYEAEQRLPKIDPVGAFSGQKANFWMAQAQQYEAQNLYAEASECLFAALVTVNAQHYPVEVAGLYGQLARLLLYQHKAELALAHFEKALETLPDEPQYWEELAKIRYTWIEAGNRVGITSLTNQRSALESGLVSLELFSKLKKPDLAKKCHQQLGELFDQMGLSEVARMHYHQALQ